MTKVEHTEEIIIDN